MSDLAAWIKGICDQMFDKGGLIDNTFEIKRIPYDFIADKLCKSARSSRDIIGNVTVVPNKYIVRFSPEDRALRKQFDPILVKELHISLEKELKKWGGVNGDSKKSIVIESDSVLDRGNFYIECHFIPQVDNKIKKKKPVLYSSQREDVSKTTIPPSSSKELKNGTLIRTLLNSENLSKTSKELDFLMCNIKVSESEGEKAYYVPEGIYFAGRGKKADIQINIEDHKVSRNHLEFVVDKSGLTVKMIGKNGGLFNSEFIAPGVEFYMNSGDSIIIGNADITINLEKMKSPENDCYTN